MKFTVRKGGWCPKNETHADTLEEAQLLEFYLKTGISNALFSYQAQAEQVDPQGEAEYREISITVHIKKSTPRKRKKPSKFNVK